MSLTQQVLAALDSLFGFLINQEWGIGQRQGKTVVVTLVGAGTFERVSPTPLPVRSAIIQHIGPTTTEAVTITTDQTNQVAALGQILNPPTTSGFGGGAIVVDNVDLYNFWYTRVSAGVTLCIYYEK